MATGTKTLRDRILYWLEGIWLPIHAHLDGIGHLARGHHVEFFNSPDPWTGHLGFIECRECPDCEGSDLCIWGHQLRWLGAVTRVVCARLGHPGQFEWKTRDDIGSGEWACERCLAPLPPEK